MTVATYIITNMNSSQKHKKSAAKPDNNPSGNDESSGDTLREELLANNEYFKRMINLVPANFYFDQDSKEKLNEQKNTALESLNNKGSNKRTHSRELSERAQRKRLKYDPTQQHTVTGLQEALIQQEEDEKQKGKKKKKKPDDDDDDDDDDDSSLKSSAESLDELHDKLQRKIDALRAKRNALSKSDAVAKKRMKRKEKKMKFQMKHRGNKVKGQTSGGDGSAEPTSPTFKSPSKPIFNKEGKMVFSKFDFSESPAQKKDAEHQPTGTRKYKKLLEKVEQRKQKLQKLKETDEEKAKSVQEKISWQSAMKKAEGVKVKDNPDLLKKTLKRHEKRKQKSRQEWKERSDQVQQKMKEKQDKRRKNIKSRKQAKVDKKIKKAKKKGRMIPGF